MEPVTRWLIHDPFIASSDETTVEILDTQEAAESRLAELLSKDEDGYCGCIVIPEPE